MRPELTAFSLCLSLHPPLSLPVALLCLALTLPCLWPPPHCIWLASLFSPASSLGSPLSSLPALPLPWGWGSMGDALLNVPMFLGFPIFSPLTLYPMYGTARSARRWAPSLLGLPLVRGLLLPGQPVAGLQAQGQSAERRDGRSPGRHRLLLFLHLHLGEYSHRLPAHTRPLSPLSPWTSGLSLAPGPLCLREPTPPSLPLLPACLCGTHSGAASLSKEAGAQSLEMADPHWCRAAFLGVTDHPPKTTLGG